MDGGLHRYELRVPRSAALAVGIMAAVFMAYVWSGAPSRALDGDPLTGSAFFDLALVVFGAFSLVGLPWVLIKLWRQRLLDPSVELDPMGVVASGLTFSGDEVRIAYADVRAIEHRKRSGVRLLTILSSSGERISLRDKLFPTQDAYAAFLGELEHRVRTATARDNPSPDQRLAS